MYTYTYIYFALLYIYIYIYIYEGLSTLAKEIVGRRWHNAKLFDRN